MISKRLLGVVTVKDGWAVQSFGYQRWLPLGRPEVLIDNLDRWGADEILLQCIDRGTSGPDFALLEKVSRLGLATPLIYAGGIKSADEAIRTVKLGADRICIDSLLHDDPAIAEALAAPLGAQALIAALPLSLDHGELRWLDHRTRQSRALPAALMDVITRKVVSEVLLIDWRHEGHANSFDMGLLKAFAPPGIPRIAFGGLSQAHQLAAVLDMPDTAAVAVGNFLNYSEHAVQSLRKGLAPLMVRPAHYRASSLE